MQGGSYTRPIVQNLKGICHYYRRGRIVTEFKKAAHQRHRSRVHRDLKLAARDPETELDLNSYEGLDAWDVF